MGYVQENRLFVVSSLWNELLRFQRPLHETLAERSNYLKLAWFHAHKMQTEFHWISIHFNNLLLNFACLFYFGFSTIATHKSLSAEIFTVWASSYLRCMRLPIRLNLSTCVPIDDCSGYIIENSTHLVQNIYSNNCLFFCWYQFI